MDPYQGRYFITANGRRILAENTDQAGSHLKIRTVSRYTSGDPINRPQVCVLCADLRIDEARDRAQRRAAQLDDRGHTPIPWLMPDDWPLVEPLLARCNLAEPHRVRMKSILIEGTPIGEAANDAPNPRNTAGKLRRYIRDLEPWLRRLQKTRPRDKGGL